MANPNDIENENQKNVTNETPDALEAQKIKEAEEQEKALKKEKESRAEQGEMVMSNSFVEKFLRALGKIKEFFTTLVNKDAQLNVGENQGSGHYIHEEKEAKTMTLNPMDFYKTDPVVVSLEVLASLSIKGDQEATKALYKRAGQEEADRLIKEARDSQDIEPSKEPTKDNEGQEI